MRAFAIFRYALRSSLVQTLGWGISLMALAVYIVLLHDAFIDQEEQFSRMLDAYPPEMMAAFGGTVGLFRPTGFLNFTYFSYVPVILGFLAVSTGAGLLSADEERGRLDLLASYPLSRVEIIGARLLAALVRFTVILGLSWLGFVLFMPGTGLEKVNPGQIALPHLELLVLMTFFTGLALLLSQLLPSRAVAAGAASAVLLASYILKVLLELDGSLAGLEKFSPLHYIKGGYAVEGLDAGGMAGLLGLGLAFTALAAWRFQRRDLRVSGEGSWPAWMRPGSQKKALPRSSS